MNPIKHPFRLSMAALLCGVLAYRASAWELPLRLSENTGQGGLHQISGVPVLDPMLVSLKYAEMLVDYRQSGMPVKSTAGLLLA